MSNILKYILRLVGIPLLRELAQTLISWIKFVIESQKEKARIKKELKEAEKNARRYKESNSPDDFNKLP